MKDLDVAAFKRELENYGYYKCNLEGIRKLIDLNEYLLGNVKGIDPSREPGSMSVTWVDTEQFERIAKELDRLHRQEDLRIAQISYIESILDRLTPEIREACVEIYVNGKSYFEVASGKYISGPGLFKQVNNELAEILKELTH